MIAFHVELGYKDEWFRTVCGHILQPERREGRALRSFNGVTIPSYRTDLDLHITGMISPILQAPTLSGVLSLKYYWWTIIHNEQNFYNALSSQLLCIYLHALSCLG